MDAGNPLQVGSSNSALFATTGTLPSPCHPTTIGGNRAPADQSKPGKISLVTGPATTTANPQEAGSH